MMLLAAAIMFTVLALFLGESVLAFLAEQLERRRTYRLELEREQTHRVELEQHRVAMIWHQLQGEPPQLSDQGQP